METARRTFSSPQLPEYQLTHSHSTPHLFQTYNYAPLQQQVYVQQPQQYFSPQVQPLKQPQQQQQYFPPMPTSVLQHPQPAVQPQQLQQYFSPAPLAHLQQQKSEPQLLYFSQQHTPVLQPWRQCPGTPGPVRRDLVDRSSIDAYHTPQVTRHRQQSQPQAPLQKELLPLNVGGNRPAVYDTPQDRHELADNPTLESTLAENGEQPVPRGTPRTAKRAKRCMTRGLKSAFNFLAQMNEVDNEETRQIDSEFIDEEREKRHAEELQVERERQEKKLQKKMQKKSYGGLQESTKRWLHGQDGLTFQLLDSDNEDLLLDGGEDDEPFLSRKTSNY